MGILAPNTPQINTSAWIDWAPPRPEPLEAAFLREISCAIARLQRQHPGVCRVLVRWRGRQELVGVEPVTRLGWDPVMRAEYCIAMRERSPVQITRLRVIWESAA